MTLRYGIVVESHPEDHSVDVVMTDDFSRLAGIQVLCSNGGSSSGTADLFVPEPATGNNKWDLSKRTSADYIAAVDFSGHMPVVIGFRYPQIGQMTFADKNRRVQRHSSDVYSTTDSAGNFELSMPNGTFLRIADTPDHEDLTGKDFDGNWAIAKNKAAATHFRLVLGNAGSVVADFHIDPSGNTSLTIQGSCTITIAGNSVTNVQGFISNTSQSIIDFNAPTVNVQNALTVGNGASGTLVDVNGKVATFQAGICTDIS